MEHPNPYMREVLRRQEVVGRLAAFDCEPVEYMPPTPKYKSEPKKKISVWVVKNIFLP